MDNQNVRIIISFIAGLVIGFGVYWIADQRKTDIVDEVGVSTNETASSTALVMQGDNGVAVANQAAGKTVTVDQVVLKRPGWVAIHDNNNGTPGRILGAQVFDFGKSSGTVELLRNTVPGTSYIAVLHNDDGNYKKFNVKTDLPLKDATGALVMKVFTTEAAAK